MTPPGVWGRIGLEVKTVQQIFVAVAVLWSFGFMAFAQQQATALATVAAGKVISLTLTSGGSGYVVEPGVSITGGGGQGAMARAVLDGDRVGAVVLVEGGSGYLMAPEVVVDRPEDALDGLPMDVVLVPKLTVRGPRGTAVRVEWATGLTGPWTAWTNVVLGSEGSVLVDMEAGSEARFYRSLKRVPKGGPDGFVWVAAGAFQMGSPVGEDGRFFDETLHEVVVSRGFWMSDHEVTQEEYEGVMGTNPSFFKGATLPVERVSWEDAVEYCRRLTDRERAAGRVGLQQAFRLPTEAEWEYAARGGTTGPRHGELGAIAWWSGNSGSQTRPVRQKEANAWGLHDMLGNVWEWCLDWYGSYPAGVVQDPMGPASGPTRVLRGGCWGCGAPYARAAFRNGSAPTYRSSNLGFRVILAGVR